jgi:cellulose synthase/poly-beta-1,6-N-acetylglucosamine synthase-like glycosyltransferase
MNDSTRLQLLTWRQTPVTHAPAISVIVPAGDVDTDLEVRLAAVLAQTTTAHEIVVIDVSQDGRHLHTVARIGDAESRNVIRYLRAAAAGASEIRRVADRVATGNIRALVRAGSRLPRTWIEQLVRALQVAPAPALL